MKRLIFFTIIISILSGCAKADDVMEFSVRGVTPSTNVMEACNHLAPMFPASHLITSMLGEADNDQLYAMSSNAIPENSEGNRDGCRGQYEVYDKRIGSGGGVNTRNDFVEVWAKNSTAYAVSSKQRMRVGEKVDVCVSQRKEMVATLLGKYGEPRAHREEVKGDATFVQLIWDYSPRNDARFGDDDYEYFEAYIQCDNNHKNYAYGRMILNTLVHSGRALIESRKPSSPDVTKYKPQL